MPVIGPRVTPNPADVGAPVAPVQPKGTGVTTPQAPVDPSATADAVARLRTGPVAGGTNTATLRTGGAVAVPRAIPVAIDLSAHGVKDVNTLPLDKVKAKIAGNADAANVEAFIKQPTDAFRAVVLIDPKDILPAPLNEALAGQLTIETHTNQYQTAAGTFGNNILLNPRDNAPLIKLLEAERDNGIWVKDMTHRAQGFGVAGPDPTTLGSAFKGDRGSKGTTHRGLLDVGYDVAGTAQVVFTDWPMGYGHHLSGEYTPLVSRWSLDDVKFTGKPLEAAEKKGYYDTIRSYEALFAMTVPFSRADSRPGFRQYSFSPLEDKTAADMGKRLDWVLDALSDDPTVAAKGNAELAARSFYCSEGAVTSIHAGTMVPLNQNSVDRGLITQSSLDRLKEMQRVFDAAGGQEKGKADLGWQALVAAKLVKSSHYSDLQRQNLQFRPIKLSPDNLIPLKERGAITANDEGLLHKDQHVGGLVQGMMATNFPRETIAQQLAARFVERATANPAIVAGVAEMLGAPGQATAEQLAPAFGWAVAAQFQAKMIASDEMQATIKKTMGYDLLDQPSQDKVTALLADYAAVIGNPKLDRAQFNEAIAKLDERSRATEVNFPSLNWQGLITHVPPHSSRDVFLGVSGHQWVGLRPAFDILDSSIDS